MTDRSHILNSGNCLYVSNSWIQSASDVGGFSPSSFHLTIDSPDSVNLVTPPSKIKEIFD